MLGESCGNCCLSDIPEFDTSIIGARKQESFIVRNLALPHPVRVPDERLFEPALEIPHFDGFVGGAAHEEILLLREAQL